VTNENVVTGALGHVPLQVEHDGFLDTGADGFHLGHDVVQVVEALDARIERFGMVARRGHGHDVQTRFVEGGGVELDGGRDADHAGLGAQVGVESQIAHAAADDQTDVAVGDAVATAAFHDNIRHLFRSDRNCQADGFCRFVQAHDVGFEPEDLAVVGANALEDTVAVEESMVEDGDLRVRLGIERAVDVDQLFGHVWDPRVLRV
jgi:hypothetical protein